MKKLIISTANLTREASNLMNGSALAPVMLHGSLNVVNYNYGNVMTCQSWLRMMKGTPPADFSTLTANSSRSADILSSSLIPGFVTNPTANTLRIDTGGTYTTASASGLATWFWIMGDAGSGSVYSFYQYWPGVLQMIGTVSGTGGGGDLEIPAPNIVAGQKIKLSNFVINLGTSSAY